MRQQLLLALLMCFGWVIPAVGQSCTLTDTNMVFGTYTGALLNGTSTGTITHCSGSWTIPLDAGTGSGATETIRKMTGPGGATLNYGVFTNAARTTNWGNTTNSEGAGSGNASITFYGQVVAGQQLLAPGTYTDTLTSATTTFTVTATIQASCTISAGNLAFGVYSGVQTDSTAALSVTCTNKTPYYVNLGNGQNQDSGYWPRMLGPNASLLSYIMYQDSARSIVWRNTYNLDGESETGTGTAQALTVYGRIASGQNVVPGSYNDIVVATLTY